MKILFTNMCEDKANIFKYHIQKDFENISIYYTQKEDIPSITITSHSHYEMIVMGLEGRDSIYEITKRYPKARIIVLSYDAETMLSFGYKNLYNAIERQLSSVLTEPNDLN